MALCGATCRRLLRYLGPMLPTILLMVLVVPMWQTMISSSASANVQVEQNSEPDGVNYVTEAGKEMHLIVGKSHDNITRATSSAKQVMNQTVHKKSDKAIRTIQGVEVLDPSHVHVIGYQKPLPGYLTIGIPTVWRRIANATYLKATLASIIQKTTEVDKAAITVLIFLADFDETHRKQLKEHIVSNYQRYIDSGFIQILQIEKEAYPPLDNLKENFNDSPKRVKWRSKQVVDFAFMFEYGRNLSRYYIQLEDDVICTTNFFTSIKLFVLEQKKPWVTLQFSELGFIGKLYKSSDLHQFAQFLMLFYQEMPVDFLHTAFAKLLTYPNMPLRKPTLFQHMGEYSSLMLAKGQKLNKLKDKHFRDGSVSNAATEPVKDILNVIPKHDSPKDFSLPKFDRMLERIPNGPPARFYTNIETYLHNNPPNAYTKSARLYFWGKTIKVNSTFVMVFNDFESLEKVSIFTGHNFQRNDYLREGNVAVSPREASKPMKEGECVDYLNLGSFKNGIFEANNLTTKVSFPVKCLRILVTKQQDEWLIIREISVVAGHKS